MSRSKLVLIACSMWSCAQAGANSTARVASPAAQPVADPFQQSVEWKPDDLTAPKGVAVRVRSPSAALPRVVKLIGEPSLAGFSDLRAMAGLVLGGELSSLIDFDAPMDAFIMDSEQSSVVAVARLRESERFDPKKLSDKLAPVSRGRWEIRPSDGGELLRCELWRVALPVGFRVACGQAKEDLERVTPYLLGKLEKQPLATDIRFELSQAMLGQVLGDESKPDEKEAADAVASHWVASMRAAQTMAFNVKMLEQDIELGVEFEYRADGASPTLEAWVAGKEKLSLPPQFWQVLDQSPIAIASAGPEGDTLHAFAQSPLFRRFVAEQSAGGDTPPDLGATMSNELSRIFSQHPRLTASFGPETLARAKNGTDKRAAGERQKTGWYLVGFAASEEGYKAMLAFAESIKGAAPSSSRAAAQPVLGRRIVPIKKSFKELPENSLVFRSESAEKRVTFIWMLPTPGWLWTLVADSEASLLAQAERLLPNLKTPVAAAPDQVAPFGDDPPLLAATLSLAAIKELYPNELRHLDAGALPFGGSARIFLRLNGNRRRSELGDSVSFAVWSRWSPAALADLVAAFKAYERRSPE